MRRSKLERKLTNHWLWLTLVTFIAVACNGGTATGPQSERPDLDGGPTEDSAAETQPSNQTNSTISSDSSEASSSSISPEGSGANDGVSPALVSDDADSQVSGDNDGGGNLAGDGGNGSVADDSITNNPPSDDAAAEGPNSTDGGSLPRPPEVSPITTLVESLLPGAAEVDCSQEDPCALGDCTLDTPCEGDFTIEAAADLTQLLDCTTVTGDLFVGAAELTTLDALQSLVTVGGSLTITGNDALESLAGFVNLRSVAGDLSIGDLDTGNASLVDLEGLEQLRFVGGTFRIVNNPALQTLDGLGLIAHQGSLVISDNPGLHNLEALASLTCLQKFSLTDSPAVTSLDGLSNLEQLGGLGLFSSPLTNLDALKALQWIPGIVEFYELDALPDLSGLSGLIGLGSMYIRDCDQLASYVGLDNLIVVRDDLQSTMPTFAGLGQLQAVGGTLGQEALGGSVGGLDSIEAVGYLDLNGDIDLDGLRAGTLFGNVNISYNSDVEDLHGLEDVVVSEGLFLTANSNLTTLEGFHRQSDFLVGLTLYSNPKLTDITVFSGVRAFYNQIVIRDNVSLVGFAGLDSVEHIENRLLVQDNAPFPAEGSVGFESLRSFDGWLLVEDDFDMRWVPNLESVGTLSLQSDGYSDLSAFARLLVKRGLWISQNQGLQSLDGLRHDGALEDDVHLEEAQVLVNLEGLRGVTSIGELDISANALLTDLEGLNDVESIGSRLTIADNPSLTNVEALNQLTTVGNDQTGDAMVASITDNTGLAQCAAEALVARVTDAAHGLATGNDANGVCQ